MIYVNAIRVMPSSRTMSVGDSAFFRVMVSPDNATKKSVKWTSDNPTVATVNSLSGLVMAQSGGVATIRATAKDGSGVYGSCTVTVDEPITEETINGLKAKTQCYVRITASMGTDSILKGLDGHSVILEKDDTVYLLDNEPFSQNNRYWYRILYDGMMLYVTADDDSFEEIYIDPPAAPTGRSVTVNTNSTIPLNVRSVPNSSTQATVIGSFNNGTEIIVTNETPQNEGWYAIYGQLNDGNYSYGWCFGEFIGNYVEYGTLIDVDSLNIRSGPGTNNSKIGTIIKGTTVQILDKNCKDQNGDVWYKISCGNIIGYVFAGSKTYNFTTETKWVAISANMSNDSIYSISSNAVAMLKNLEGFSSTAYIASPWEPNYTIGYGHVIEDGGTLVTIDGVTYGEITEELASTLLIQDLNTIYIPLFYNFLQINNIVLNQNQYDACIMDCYQKGQNIWEKQERPIAKFILAKQDFDDYNKVLAAFVDDTTHNGLINRRTKEANLFVYNTYTYT